VLVGWGVTWTVTEKRLESLPGLFFAHQLIGTLQRLSTLLGACGADLGRRAGVGRGAAQRAPNGRDGAPGRLAPQSTARF
jgi:hypothetical protein